MTKKNTVPDLKSEYFGSDFIWGVSSSAPQTEGAWDKDGRGPSVWDHFASKRKKILYSHTPGIACDFYNRYPEDISIIKTLGIPNFRYSLSWSRILPDGIGKINEKGIDHYRRLFDECNKRDIQPWITLYHWDLPQALQLKGGWKNRDIIHWFEEYASVCARAFNGSVKNWMVLNEPSVFTGAGYFLGVHAPGEKGLKKFLPAVHHSVLCQAIGAAAIRREVKEANVGSTYACSHITPNSNSPKDLAAANRIDTILNRLFIEPSLGLGYPVKDIPLLNKIKKYFREGDEELMKVNFDFIGLQCYTREVVRHAYFTPHIKARLVPADRRKVYHTIMDWEVYPEAIYETIKKYSAYQGVKNIIITENGAAFNDKPENNKVHDHERTHFLSNYIAQVYRAKKEGHKVQGYFVWSLTDNFEWAEGYYPRFGLVYIDYETQKRIIKDSGHWFKKFLKA
jgi:beta-glucosidase